MTRQVNAVVVGSGQARLSVGHYLAEHAVERVVLEQADRPGDTWRSHLAERRTAIKDAHATSIVPQGALHGPERARATTRWADRVMTLIWSSALSLTLDGFAGYAAGIYPTAVQNLPHHADSAIAPANATP